MVESLRSEIIFPFSVTDAGCASYVGRKGGKQEIEMGRDCFYHGDARHIRHELLHALGFLHEQNRFINLE